MNKIKLIACGAVVSAIGSMPAAAVVNPTHHDASHRRLVRNSHLNNAVPHRNMSLLTTSPQPDVRQDPLSQMLDDNTQTAINIQEWHHGDSSL